MFLFFCQHCQCAKLRRLFKEKAAVGFFPRHSLARSWAVSFYISKFKVSYELLLCFVSFLTEGRAVLSSPSILMHSVASACYFVVLA